jgi:hypothetical protein
VTESEAQLLSNEMAVVLSLCIPSLVIAIRRFGLTILPFVYQACHGAKLLSCSSDHKDPNAWTTQPTPMSSSALLHHQSAFEETLASIGDEDNPLKAMQTLVAGLRNARDTEDSVSAELGKLLKKDIPLVLGRILWSLRWLSLSFWFPPSYSGFLSE